MIKILIKAIGDAPRHPPLLASSNHGLIVFFDVCPAIGTKFDLSRVCLASYRLKSGRMNFRIAP